MVEHPGAHLRCHGERPQPLERRNRHARAGNPERQPRIVAGKIEAAVERHAEVGVADFARLEIDALLVGIDAQPQLDAIEDQRIRVDRRGREHRAAAGDLQPPNTAAVVWRIELREQRDAVAAGDDLKRRRQRPPTLVPIETDLSALDGNAHERVLEIDDDPLLHQHAALEHMRNTVGTDVGADAAG